MTLQEAQRFAARAFPYPVELITNNGVKVVMKTETREILAAGPSWKAALRHAIMPVLKEKLVAEAAADKQRAEEEQKLQEQFVEAKQGGVLGKIKTKLFGVKK